VTHGSTAAVSRRALLPTALLLACRASPASTGSLASPAAQRLHVLEHVPNTTPAADPNAVVAEGSCWVSGHARQDSAASDTRFVYARGLLQRVEWFATDHKTVLAYEQLDYDAKDELVARVRWEPSAAEPERWRETWDRDHHGRILRWRRIAGGKLEHESLFRQGDDFGHPISGSVRTISGELHEDELRWTPTRAGGWTVETPVHTRSYSDKTSVTSSEIWTIDDRGRAVERTRGLETERWKWDSRGRCIEHIIPGGTLLDGWASPPVTRIYWAAGRNLQMDTITRVDSSRNVIIDRTFDSHGNVVERKSQGKTTRFVYEGDFRNAICDRMEPLRGAMLWRECDLSTQ
jgi:YD repeat-containing protein